MSERGLRLCQGVALIFEDALELFQAPVVIEFQRCQLVFLSVILIFKNKIRGSGILDIIDVVIDSSKVVMHVFGSYEIQLAP